MGTDAHQYPFKGLMALQQQKTTSLSTGLMERQRKTLMNSSNSISAVLCDMELHCCQKSIKITSMSPCCYTSWHVSGVHFEAVHKHYPTANVSEFIGVLEGNKMILLHYHKTVEIQYWWVSVKMIPCHGHCFGHSWATCFFPFIHWGLCSLWGNLHFFSQPSSRFQQSCCSLSEMFSWDTFLFIPERADIPEKPVYFLQLL